MIPAQCPTNCFNLTVNDIFRKVRMELFLCVWKVTVLLQLQELMHRIFYHIEQDGLVRYYAQKIKDRRK